MASKTSEPVSAKPVIDMAELGARIARRRAEAAIPQLPRNAGARRTASKTALLDEIAARGGKW